MQGLIATTIFDALPRSPRLKTLGLPFLQLRDEELIALSAALSRGTSIESLDVGKNIFERAGLIALGAMLSQTPSITTFTMSHMLIQVDGLKPFLGTGALRNIKKLVR